MGACRCSARPSVHIWQRAHGVQIAVRDERAYPNDVAGSSSCTGTGGSDISSSSVSDRYGDWAASVLLSYRLLLKQRYGEFLRFQEIRAEMNARIWRVLPYVCVAAGVLTIPVVASWNVRITDQALIVKRLVSFSEAMHLYSDITSIETGQVATRAFRREGLRREYIVRFRDGFSWDTNAEPSSASLARKREVIDFISKNSGVPIVEVGKLHRRDFDLN